MIRTSISLEGRVVEKLKANVNVLLANVRHKRRLPHISATLSVIREGLVRVLLRYIVSVLYSETSHLRKAGLIQSASL